MAKDHSFLITVSNNKTEIGGFDFLLKIPGFYRADSAAKKQILTLLGLPLTYRKAFDLVYIEDLAELAITPEIVEAHIDKIILVELKTTKKYLPESPKGFFFGATENEFNFGKLLGEKFRFCFVCLNERSPSYKMLTVDQLEPLIRTRRIQFQVNL